MKKLKTRLKKVLFTFMAVFLPMSGMNLPTHAAENSLTKHFYSDINYQMSKSDGSVAWGAGFTLTMNGKHVFCVDPTTDAESGSGFTASDFSHAKRDEMSIISYEGYYKHRNDSDLKYWNMASQLMIWETMGWTVTSVTGFNYASYKTSIQNAVNRHSVRPSFNGNKITLKVGESITLNDTNGVFNEFHLVSDDGLIVSKSGNSLTITGTINAKDESTIIFNKVPGSCVGTSIIYRKAGAQDVADLFVTDPLPMNIKVNVQKYGKVRITKHDESSDKVVQRAGIEYEIYNATDNALVSTITSDESGAAESGLLLFGDYYYVEKQAPDKYLVNSTPHYFTISKSFTVDEFEETSISDAAVTAKSILTKEDKETGATAQGNATLEGAVYGFYAAEDIYDPANDGTIKYHKDELVSTHTIKNRQATATVNYLGKYYWFEDQDNASKGYLPDPQKHYVNLLYQDQNTPVVVANTVSLEQVKKQAFQIEKLESSGTSGELPPLSGAEFTYILSSYIEKYGSFDKAVNVAEARDGRILESEWGRMVTDDNGYAKSKELPFGEYTVRETVVPKDHNAVDDFTITIKEDSRKPLRMRFFEDKTMSTKLAVVKKDAETGETIALSDMRFKVKALTKTADFEAGEYVGYWAWNPLPHYVNEWTTSEDGTVMLEMSLKAGTYQIEEIESPYGYLKNHEPLTFTITGGWHQQLGPDQETLITTVIFKDQSVKGQVQIDKQAELFKGYQSEMTEYGELFTPVYEKGLLAGAKFQITAKTDIVGMDGTVWYEAGEVVETLTSDGENLTTSSLLPLGSEGNNIYSLQEIETAEGYVVDSTVHDFRFDYVDEETEVVNPTWLDEDGKEIETKDAITLNNEKQTGIAVTSKAMETSIFDHEDAYQNVMFGVYANEVNGLESDSLVGLSTVDKEGNVNAALSQAGSYYLQEITTDDNYVLDETKYPFTYEYNGDKVQTITVNNGVIKNNLKRAMIEVIKYTEDEVFYSEAEQKAIENMGEDMSEFMRNDLLEDDRHYLAFTEFELASDKEFKNIVQTGKTDITGRLVFENLELGTYFIREKGSSEFYEINDEVFKVTLSKENQMETVEVKNDLIESYIDVKKVDSEDPNKTLSNAEFTMYEDEDCTKEITTVQTNKEGIAHFDNIQFGQTVYIKETAAPRGYELSDEVIKITIDEDWVKGDKDTRIIEVKNDLITSYVEIKKVDYYDHSKTLPYAGFTMYEDAACTKAIKTVQTDQDGIAHFDNIQFGQTVYFKETSAPTGYKLSNQIVKVTIDEDWINGNKETRIIVYPDQLLPSSSVNTGSNVTPWTYLGLVGISAAVMMMLEKKKKETE